MSQSMLGVMNLSMARFIAIYATLFESAQKVLDGSITLPIAKKWNFEAASFQKIYQERVEGDSLEKSLE